MKHVFIVGSNGIPAAYGGFETFVEQLTSHKQSPQIKYHISCLSDENKEFEYNDAHCFAIKVPNLGPATANYYDVISLNYCCNYIAANKIEQAIVYVLGAGIGPMFGYYRKKLHRLGTQLFINPDGLEWKRDKWNAIIKQYFKYCEKKVMQNADLVICDSKNIEKYMQTEYKEFASKTKFIAYGADIKKATLTSDLLPVKKWFTSKKLKENNYYLVVGRFVPENNYKTILLEFMKSTTQKDLVLITNVERNSFYNQLQEETHFDQDSRIKFVGTVYDQQLLIYIREHAYGYIHGHEVGGTNPSLLEALACTNLNLLLDVGFNREVGENGALYWNKERNSLGQLILQCDSFSEEEIHLFESKAKSRISDYYNWDNISHIYEQIFARN